MSFLVTKAATGAAVATDETVVFDYPTGKAAADFVTASGAELWIDGLQALVEQGASTFTLTYGGSNITMTYKGLTPIPMGSDLILQIPTPTTPLAAIADLSGSDVAAVETGVNAILDRLRDAGIIAAS